MSKNPPSIFKRRHWLMGALLVLVVIQGYFVWKDYARPWLSLIRHYGLVSGFQRGEIVYIGYNEAKYVRFLDAYVPKDSPVLLPDSDNAAFTNQSIMQFYLFPRQIWLCGNPMSDQCLELSNDPNVFILAIKDFPSSRLTAGKVFVPFPESYNRLNGVYAPADLAARLPVPTPEAYDRPLSIPRSAPFVEIGVWLAFFILGCVYASLFIVRPQWIDLLALSFPLAMGLLSWLIFLTSYLGASITLATVALWYGLLLVAGIFLHRRLHRSFPALPWRDALGAVRGVWMNDRGALLLAFSLAAWFCLSALVSVGQSYATFDGIANWYLKGYAMVNQHTIWAGLHWGGHVLAYPMNIPLSTGIFQLVDGDQLPGSKALFPLLAASLLLTCYRFLRRNGIGRNAALTCLLFIFTVPLFFFHSTISFANLPLAVYLVMGVLWSLDGLLNDRKSWTLLGGVLLAFAAWTRPEGIGFSLCLLLGAYGTALVSRETRVSWKHGLASILPIIVFPVTWLVLLGVREMRRDQVGNVLGGFLSAASWWKQIWGPMGQLAVYAWQYFTNWRSAGFLVAASLLLLAAAVFLKAWQKVRVRLDLLVATCMAWLFPAGMFVIYPLSQPGFKTFLDQSFSRAYLPGIVLLALSAFLVFGGEQSAPSSPDEP